MSTEHEWFRSHLIPRRLGLLSEHEASRFDEHVAACLDCGQVWESFQSEPANDDPSSWSEREHIASGMIAQWPVLSRSLRGMEREAVRCHLECCAECRHDLEFAGHAPILHPATSAELGVHGEREEARRRDWSAATSTETCGGDDVSSPAHRGSPRRPLLQWLLGTWAVAATAVLIVMVWRPQGGRPLGPGGAELGAPGNGMVLPWVSPSLDRGVDAANILTIRSDAHQLALVVRVPSTFPLDKDASVTVRSPDDRPLSHSRVSRDDLARRSVLIFLRQADPIRPGLYRVLLCPEGEVPSSESAVETRFEIHTEVK
jgi:hypothetical protein